MLGWLLRVGAPALMKIKMELMMKGKCKTDNCWDAGDGRKRCSPLSRNMSGPVMSLPVSYEIKTCYYHNSITLSEITGCTKKKRERERDCKLRTWNHRKDPIQFPEMFSPLCTCAHWNLRVEEGCNKLYFHSYYARIIQRDFWSHCRRKTRSKTFFYWPLQVWRWNTATCNYQEIQTLLD